MERVGGAVLASFAFDVVIPARYASTRLPGKPLLDVGGKTLIQRVYECARTSRATEVVVATDDARILETVTGFGGTARLTSPDHASGTDRVAQAVRDMGLGGDRIVVNLQGDEPSMPGTVLDQIAETLVRMPDAMAATACYPIRDATELENPNVVKVVMDEAGYALYFSRAPIPYPRVAEAAPAYRHVGVYAYRVDALYAFTRQAPAPLERREALEQLRILQTGGRIAVCIAAGTPGEGVDTPQDLERARRRFASHNSDQSPW